MDRLLTETDYGQKIQLKGPSFLKRCWWALTRSSLAEPTTSRDWYAGVLDAIKRGHPLYIVCGDGTFVQTEEFDKVAQALRENGGSVSVVISERSPLIGSVKAAIGNLARQGAGKVKARLWKTAYTFRNHFSLLGDEVFFEFPHEADAKPDEKRGVKFSKNAEQITDCVEQFNRILAHNSTEKIV